MSELKLGDCTCPECKQDYNGLSIESSSELQISIITCSECGFNYSGGLSEEDLTDKFLKEVCNE